MYLFIIYVHRLFKFPICYSNAHVHNFLLVPVELRAQKNLQCPPATSGAREVWAYHT